MVIGAALVSHLAWLRATRVNPAYASGVDARLKAEGRADVGRWMVCSREGCGCWSENVGVRVSEAASGDGLGGA